MIQGSRSWLIIGCICSLAVSQAAVAMDGEPPFGVDDRLTVSLAEAGQQSFPETDLVETVSTAVLSFDDVNGLGYCDPWPLTAGEPVFDDDGNQTGEIIFARRISDNMPFSIGYGSGALACGSANEYGGASAVGSYVAPQYEQGWTVTFTNPQKYVGFWWSAGNDRNFVQLLDEQGQDILDPLFSATSLYQTIFGSPNQQCIVGVRVNEYCGNPNSEWVSGAWDPPLDFGTGPFSFNRGVPNEPYAFVHLRYESGFHGIRFSGDGFELDNLTISEESIAFGQEEEVIGETPQTYTLVTSPVIPVDPRSQNVSFPGILLGGDAIGEDNATMCITQVTNSSGATPVDSENATIRLSTPGNENISQSGQPPNFVFSGGQNEVQAFSSQIRIVTSTTNRSVASSSPVWLRVSVSAQSAGGESTCAITGGEVTASVVELRPLRLTNNTMFRVSLD